MILVSFTGLRAYNFNAKLDVGSHEITRNRRSQTLLAIRLSLCSRP